MSEPLRLVPGEVALTQWREAMSAPSVALNDDAWAGIERGAAIVERVVAGGAPTYGVNTGFGKLASISIATDDLAALQRNLILSHAAGVGPALPDAIVRLLLAMKAASLARGASRKTRCRSSPPRDRSAPRAISLRSRT